MDWTTFFASITGNAVLLAFFVFIFKSTFTNYIKSSLKRIEEKHIQSIREEIRREAFMFDEQYTAIRESAEILYRIRNSCRDSLRVIKERERQQTSKMTKELKKHFQLLEEHCFRTRAILPQNIFNEIHGQKSLLIEFISHAESTSNKKDRESSVKPIEAMDMLYREIEKSFNIVLMLGKSHLGIESV